jgi:hypothetical protein
MFSLICSTDIAIASPKVHSNVSDVWTSPEASDNVGRPVTVARNENLCFIAR